MIRITFQGASDKRLALALKARGPQLVQAERRTLDGLMAELQAVVQRKLSGEVLKSHRGGGGLLGSVRRPPVAQVGSQLVGQVQAGGGMFWWAIVHERGGEKEYEILPKNKQALAFFPAGSIGASMGSAALRKLYAITGRKRGSLRAEAHEAFGEAGGIVRKKAIHPPLPKRSFMATALQEMQGRIISRVFATAAEALRS